MQNTRETRPGSGRREREAAPRKGADREKQVQQIFSEIAPRYDLLNHVLSLNIDRSWRGKAIDRLGWEGAPEGTYLDACAGTFDLALELASRKAPRGRAGGAGRRGGGRSGFAGRVVASDFAHPMLVEGAPKIAASAVTPVCADSLVLPFDDDTFDGATVGFGVRNLADLERGLAELHRVLRPGSRLVVLEFTLPPNPVVRAGYLLYCQHVLPVIGRIVSGHPWAYTYLPASVREFPAPAELGGLFERVGFRDVGWKLLSFGIAAIHWGTA